MQKSLSAVAAGAMPWEGVQRVCPPGFLKPHERLQHRSQCPLLVPPVVGGEVTEPAPIEAAQGCW